MSTSDVNLDMVTQAAAEAARDYSFPVSVVGTVPTGDGSDYVEIVLRIDGCHKDPCHLQLGVFRGSNIEHIRTQIVEQIRRHLNDR